MNTVLRVVAGSAGPYPVSKFSNAPVLVL